MLPSRVTLTLRTTFPPEEVKDEARISAVRHTPISDQNLDIEARSCAANAGGGHEGDVFRSGVARIGRTWRIDLPIGLAR